MESKKKVYSAFAELIYSVVMADGEIREPEKLAIASIVKEHPIAQDIKRYFDSNIKGISIAQSFIHTLEVCKEHGEDVEYPFLLAIVERISKVSEGIESDDESILTDFVVNFRRKFYSN